MKALSRDTENLALTGVGLLCAGASASAFFLHFLGWLQMPFLVNFAVLPITILMLVVGLYSWNRRLPFWKRFSAGLAGGAIGLVAYDVIRFAIYRSGLLNYDPYHAIPILGSLITGQPATLQSSVIAGWVYHFWNGFSFAIIYALIAGPAPWKWGVVWAMFLENGMLLSYPSLLAIQASIAFVGVSLIGHGAYGIAVGLSVSRLAQTGELR